MVVSEEEYLKRLEYVKNLDKRTKYVSLKTGTKIPSTGHGHLDGTTEVPVTENWGIVLDYLYLVVDFDSNHPERVETENNLPPTWCQSTSRPGGMHYLYKMPEGFEGHNAKLKAKDGQIIADIKVKGYIVGPGSIFNGQTYTLIDNRRPHQHG